MWGAWCILILCQLVPLPVIRSEKTFHLRDRHDNLRYRAFNDKNLITSEDKAQEVLARYGYLKCGSRRQKRSLFSGFLNVIPDEGERASISRTCTKMEVEDAIKNYQRTYNMPQTGRLDSDTLSVMSESRCGNSDDESAAVPFQPLANDGLKQAHLHVSRSKRDTPGPSLSLYDIITTTAKEPASNYGPLPGTTLSRRLHWMEEYGKYIENGAFEQKLEKMYDYVQSRRRKKRSLAVGIQGHAFTSELVTWRLVESAYSNQLTINTQRKAFALAFRMWGEVIPLLFQEDTRSRVDDVDILIAFGRGEHLNCPNHFDGFGGQLAHTIKLTGNTEIHVDDDEYLTLGSEHGINLIKVAVHEVGHSLGMFHTSRNYSIMYAIYSKVIPNNNFELGWEDRKMVQKMYGICEGRFDTVFDWVRRRPDGNLIYNTYFFRSNRYWMYENRFNRTRYGDPLNIIPEWKGIPNNVDAFVHVWTYTQDKAYFFKGRYYYLYNSAEDKVASGYPREISKDFRGIPGSRFPSIPSNIDAVFFDQRDSNLYFFKGKYVYAYDIERGKEGCCLPGYPREIKLEFPSASPKSRLPSNLDAIYYSYFNRAMYFFKGKLFWENKAFNPLDRKRKNEIVGPWPIFSKWYDICEVEL